jgi:hypothetical protein
MQGLESDGTRQAGKFDGEVLVDEEVRRPQ